MKKEDFLYNILTNDNIVNEINENLNAILEIIPEVKHMINFPHNHPHHHLDVWNHTLLALSLSPNDFIIRLSLLLHDIGKPFSYQDDNNIRHFRNHPQVSAKLTLQILNRFKYDEQTNNEIYYLVLNHDNPISKKEIEANYELEYKRLIVQECDAYAHNPIYLNKRIEYIEKKKKLFKK